jgi:signal recognition particle receptor subunit beta
MVFFNHATRQMTAKIVYYGPGLCGKTTNLSAIYERTSQKARGEMVSLNTETDRTLFFDLLPLEVGVIGGFKAKLQLYTVPGQVFYNSTRKLVLKGVDGIVFVADSQTAMLDANRESIQNLTENLRELGMAIGEIPMVFQWNKRDLKQVVPVDQLEQELNPRHLTSFTAIAATGVGVFETLRGISRLALAQIKLLHLGDGTPAQAVEPVAPSPTPTPTPIQTQPRIQTPAQIPAPVPPAPAWSRPTDPPAPEPAARPGVAIKDADTHPGGTLPEALSFLDLSSDGDTHPGGALPEALSFLDLSTTLELFEPMGGNPGPVAPMPQAPPAPNELPTPVDGQVKVMAPLVVKLLPPQPARSTGSHLVAGNGGLPRVTLKAPGALALPRVPVPLRGHPGAPARPVPVLQVALPPEAMGGELEIQVQVRRNGVLVAESATAVPGPGPDGTRSLSIEFKRS